MKNRLLTGIALGCVLMLTVPAQADILIGIAGPITGPDASTGEELEHGAKQAVEDINKAGGVLGQKLVIETGDDASDPKQGVSVANKFASDGVKFVVGHFASGVSIPASTAYEDAGILEITPASTNPRYTERGMWNTFRTCGRDDQQGAVAGNYLAKHFAGKNIAFINDKTTYGKGLADETLKALRAHGGKEVLNEGINPVEKDYSALVTKLKQAQVDIVYFGGFYTPAGLIIRQMREQGVNAPLMSGDGITDKEFAQIAGPGADGTYMTFSPDPRKNPDAKDAVAEFKAQGFDPEAFTLYSYAAIQIIKAAIEQAQVVDPKKAADVMHSGKVFKTAIGDIAFDKRGDITRPDYVMYVWKKGPDGSINYAGNEIAE